jgi:hypothetical protein
MCLREDVVLKCSHLTPASVYRLLDSPNAPNHNPVLITSQGVVQTSREIKDYVLCEQCEDLLNRNGENWVLPLLATRENFPLYDLLTSVAPDIVEPDVTAYAGAKNPRLRVNDLTHFALGIFWKASVHTWKSGSSSGSRIELGISGEKIRLFLRGDAPFPEYIALGVNVMPPPVTTMLSYIPREGTALGDGRYLSFYVPGILFTLAIGKGLTKEVCFYSNPLHPVLVKDLSTEVERYPKETYFKGKAAMALRKGKK